MYCWEDAIHSRHFVNTCVGGALQIARNIGRNYIRLTPE